MSCIVEGCRFPHSHLACYHTCGTCGRMGHGQLECGNRRKITALSHQANFLNNFRGTFCTVAGCLSPFTHDSSAHVCTACHNRRPMCTCPPIEAPQAVVEVKNVVQLTCPLCKAGAQADLTQKIFASGTSCVVCFGDVPLVLLSPCNHVCVCDACANRMSTL